MSAQQLTCSNTPGRRRNTTRGILRSRSVTKSGLLGSTEGSMVNGQPPRVNDWK